MVTGQHPLLLHQGKVRDVYQWGDDLLLVASDRVSAFDVILPTPIPLKGIVLTQLSRFWFEFLGESVPHHVISFDLPEGLEKPAWRGRSMQCRKAEVIPIECIVRGYLFGSAWADYQATGCVQGRRMPAGMRRAEAFSQPIFTPSTKEKVGHDQPLTQEEAEALVGAEVCRELERLSLDIYTRAAAHAAKRGILIADTKFEFGWIDGRIVLIDELLTPDSSRLWPQESYKPGGDMPSYDKQIVRDYLLTLKNWDRTPPGPTLPSNIVEKTAQRYLEVYEHLTGERLPLFASESS